MKKDEFFWLNAVNRATVVTGLRNGQFGEDLARRAAAGIAAVEAMGEADPALRVKSYIAWEPLLIKAAGPGRDRHSRGPLEPGHPLDAAHGDPSRRNA